MNLHQPARGNPFDPIRMTLLPLLLALLLEQFRPLSVTRCVAEPLRRLADYVALHFNDGRVQSGRIAWIMVIFLAVLAVSLLYYLLWEFFVPLAVAFNVAVLYWTMGFRQERTLFGDIHLALRTDDLGRARALLTGWRGASYEDAASTELARLTIEQALVASHRNVFGVVFWFLILPGPTGPLMYRLARYFAETWGCRQDHEFGQFGVFSRQAFAFLDWLPARLTAASFSVVGNFEDALYCWRTQANQWPERSSGILIASGAGAMGVRLGLPVHESGRIVERPEMGIGDEASADFMQSAVRLVWKALLLCLTLLTLVAIAAWVGG